MKQQDGEALLSRLLRSRTVLIAEMVLLVLIAVALGKVVIQRRSVDQEITRLKQEYQQLEENKGDLEQLIAYFQTDEFKEEEARTKLGLTKPGEQLVILPQSSDMIQQVDVDSQSSPQDSESNPQRWWGYFFQ